MVEALVVGELEYRKRGRLQCIFPPDAPGLSEPPVKTEAQATAARKVHPMLVSGKANLAVAWWHRKIRRWAFDDSLADDTQKEMKAKKKKQQKTQKAKITVDKDDL
jgi:hypothetical protein